MKHILGTLACFLFIYSHSQIVTIGDLEKKSILETHNIERRSLNIPDLQWSDHLEKLSQQWALKLAKEDRDIYHSHNDQFGENISYFFPIPDNYGIEYGVQLWNEEKEFFKYGKKNKLSEVGHYTQVIWSTTTEVGCGCAKGKSGAYFFVCKYNPPGNYTGVNPY